MYYNKDTYSIYYEKYGNGDKTILILPGWGDTRKTFNYMINYFQKDYKIYILDYPGFGKSIFPDHDLTIYDYTNIVRDFIKDEGIRNPIIVAHSFGGRLAILMSSYYKDEIDKLILIDTAGIKPKKSFLGLLKLISYKLLKKLKILIPKKKRSLYIKRLINIFGSTDYKTLSINMQKTFKNIVNENLKYYIQYIEQKTLIIWGKKDKDTPLKDAKYMNKHIKNSLLILYKKASHYSYLQYPILTNQIIAEFLNSKKESN